MNLLKRSLKELDVKFKIDEERVKSELEKLQPSDIISLARRLSDKRIIQKASYVSTEMVLKEIEMMLKEREYLTKSYA